MENISGNNMWGWTWRSKLDCDSNNILYSTYLRYYLTTNAGRRITPNETFLHLHDKLIISINDTNHHSPGKHYKTNLVFQSYQKKFCHQKQLKMLTHFRQFGQHMNRIGQFCISCNVWVQHRQRVQSIELMHPC